MKHKFAVQVLLLLWVFTTTRIVYAATFLQDAKAFDYESLMTAAVAGLCGGALRTIFTLANDNRAVFAILREARKDAVSAALAGGAVYALMIAFESKWPGSITRELRFVGVVAAGWIGSGVFYTIGRLARAKVDGQAAEFRAGAASTDVPSSAPVPLSKGPT